ncbi:transcription initiation factor iie subunit alpha [Ophiostoma piceae UAMH 11346]|uniref:Transcription initiation factor iie subunit alpha n=1 Tax=Ophiostoma piceae (strain UAMH 11346) TaxID=1262450 RepID=S3CA89_OPHP1|nr:transcription initiation factor iie subunit alpha [Ophiostoma piceae UAMH 11346]
MDLAKNLVRSVARAFYETRHILIVDALVIHSAIPSDDLAYLVDINTKDLYKLCQKLREDRLITSHSRPELREGQTRPFNRLYFYIDYRQAIDAIKWRVYKIDKDLQGPVVPPSEKKEFFCDHCKAEWTQMEVLDSVGPTGFTCHRCGSVLRHGDSGQSGGHERSTRMNSQFKFITDLLPKIDSVVIPDNNFDIAYNNKRPVMRAATHATTASVGVDAMNRPTAVRGMANTGPSTLSVSIQAGSGPSEEEKAQELARREQAAKQNALPEWMSNSTITGDAFKTDLNKGVLKLSNDVKDPTLNPKADQETDAQLEDYFAKLKRQAAEEEARKAQAAEDDDDDDDEDDEDMEFEDVVQESGNNSRAATPANNGNNGNTLAPPKGVQSPRNLPKAPSPLRQAHSQTSLKREAMSDPPSPSASPKKMRMEETKPAKVEEESDEDEDDIEFVDV